jgi:hypothetical protein
LFFISLSYAILTFFALALSYSFHYAKGKKKLDKKEDSM